jgi:hypothetical protein
MNTVICFAYTYILYIAILFVTFEVMRLSKTIFFNVDYERDTTDNILLWVSLSYIFTYYTLLIAGKF